MKIENALYVQIIIIIKAGFKKKLNFFQLSVGNEHKKKLMSHVKN